MGASCLLFVKIWAVFGIWFKVIKGICLLIFYDIVKNDFFTICPLCFSDAGLRPTPNITLKHLPESSIHSSPLHLCHLVL